VPRAGPGEEYYQRLADEGLSFGPGFRALQELWAGMVSAWPAFACPSRWPLKPATTTFTPFFWMRCSSPWAEPGPKACRRASTVPIGVIVSSSLANPAAEMWSHGCLRDKDAAHGEIITVDLRLFDPAGRDVASIEGLRLKRATREAMLRYTHKTIEDWLYEIRWEPRPLCESDPACGGRPSPIRMAQSVENRLQS